MSTEQICRLKLKKKLKSDMISEILRFGMANKLHQGMALITGSTICFSLGNCLMNVVGSKVPPLQSAFFRFLVQTVVSLISIMMTKGDQLIFSAERMRDSQKVFKILLRSCLGSMGLVSWFTALQMIHLADATAINYVSIPITSILAHFILREPYRL